MGRWLTALKKHEITETGHPQNPQNLSGGGFGSFGGAGLASNANFSAHHSATSEEVFGVLSVPFSGESENSSPLIEAVAHAPAKSVISSALPDVEQYAEALRTCGPCGYGPIAVFLGWGAGRAGKAEADLRRQGRIVYDCTGRGQIAE